MALTLLPDAPSDCVSGAKDYTVVLSGVRDALRAYEQCLTASRGRSQCTDEFDGLDGTQQDFEAAVENVVKAYPLAPRAPR